MKHTHRLIRQFWDDTSKTYSYLIMSPQSNQCILVDPVLAQTERDQNYIKQCNLQLLYTLETHVHADHITGAHKLREALGCKVGATQHAELQGADFVVCEGNVLHCDGLTIYPIATPGHTSDHTCFYIPEYHCVLTGDCLLIRGCGRTDFQNGSAATLYHSITEKLWRLPEETVVFPGHDYSGFTSSSIQEERALNPRLQKTQEEFVALMNNLNLPHPRFIKEAVPANLRCGAMDDADPR